MNNRLRNKNVSFQHSGVVSIGTCIYFLNPISITKILGSAIPNFDGRGSFIVFKNSQHLPKSNIDDSLTINTTSAFVLHNDTTTVINVIPEESN